MMDGTLPIKETERVTHSLMKAHMARLDNDGYGDNPLPAFQGDACPTTYGTSFQDRFGCPMVTETDTQTKGMFPTDNEQWADSDSDGRGDNYYYDVQQFTELHINQRGDAFPMNPTQWNDTDGDGWGDNYDNASWID